MTSQPKELPMPDPISSTPVADAQEAVASIEPIIVAIADWLYPARRRFVGYQEEANGVPVYVDFSPGDMTRYSLAFVPRIARAERVTNSPPSFDYLRPEDGILCGLTGATPFACSINLVGYPAPSYVETHIGASGSNLPTVAAVGVVWCLMVGRTPHEVALAYQELAPQILEWDASRFEVSR